LFETVTYSGNRVNDYTLLLKQLTALSKDEEDPIAILSNATALLNQFLSEVNWVGFYLWKDNELVLGPFQGLPACIRIPFGKGVCGTAVKERKTLRVNDVTQFPGHIACDSASKSEIVVPIFVQDTIYGVLDVDSPVTNRFDELDETHLQKFTAALEKFLN